MTPIAAFQFIDRLLANQRLTLTPPEFSQFAQAMQVVAEAISSKTDENTTRSSKP